MSSKEKGAVEMATELASVALDHLAKLGVVPMDLLPQKLKKIALKRGQPQETANAARDFLARALRRQDKQLQRRSARIARNTLVALNKAFPGADRQLIGDIVADLNSLWDTGQKLDKGLKKLFRMRFPQQYNSLREFLAFIEATQIGMAESWIRNLRKRIPKLRLALDRQERSDRRLARTKPGPA